MVAFDMDSGKILWSFQPTQDVWVGGCKPGRRMATNCPNDSGPYHDFSMSPVLARRSNGSDAIVRQKSGMAYAMIRQAGRARVAVQRATATASAGGGARLDGRQVYSASTAGQVGRRYARGEPGHGRARCGRRKPKKRLCGTERGCSQAQGRSDSHPGIVFSVSMDGGIRAQPPTTTVAHDSSSRQP